MVSPENRCAVVPSAVQLLLWMMQSSERYSLTESPPQQNFKRRKSFEGHLLVIRCLMNGDLLFCTAQQQTAWLKQDHANWRRYLQWKWSHHTTFSVCMDTTHRIYCRLLQLCQKYLHHMQLYSTTNLQEEN